MVLFIILYKVVLTFKSVDGEFLKCNHSNKSYWAVYSCCDNFYYAAQGGCNVCHEYSVVKVWLKWVNILHDSNESC